MTFKILFDAGKPYEITAATVEDLQRELKDLYERHKDSPAPFDAKVFNEHGTDITESHLIEELIAEIIGEDSIEYSCPGCNEALCTDEGEAEQILRRKRK